MLALFCLRLALGLLAALLLLRPAQINPRFYRTHFLTVLALCCLALVLIDPHFYPNDSPFPSILLIASLVLAAVGSISWSLEGAPGGRILIMLTLLPTALVLLGQGLVLRLNRGVEEQDLWVAVVNELLTSVLLGVATTAMLMGHSYLIAPSMSLTPLKTLLSALYVTLGLQAILAGVALWLWTWSVERVSLTDVTILWLPVRWLIGLILPAVLGVMAWYTTRIRNTQSSTGILYIVVVFVFLGELMAQLLFNVTGFYL